MPKYVDSCICSHTGFFSHLFVEPKAIGGYSPVIDLKALTKYIYSFYFLSINKESQAVEHLDHLTGVLVCFLDGTGMN